MPQFEVIRKGAWFEAECRELGVLITAKTKAEVEASARKTAGRAGKQVVFKYEAPRPPMREQLRRWFARHAGIR